MQKVAQKLIQTQTQTLQQTLTPQQLLQVHLLELPLKDFEQRVNEELLANEALEEGRDDSDASQDENVDATEDVGEEEQGGDATDDALADYLSDDDAPDYLLNASNDDESRSANLPFGQQKSLYEELTAQISEHNLSDKQKRVLAYLIGSLDSDGFLRKDAARLRDEMEVYHNIETTPEEVDAMIKVLQTFEPVGIGAHNLQECLLIQLSSDDYKSSYKDAERQIISKSFKDFTKKRWDIIARRYHLDDDAVKHIRSDVRRLNPRPGSALNETVSSAAQEITPDFRVEGDGNGGLRVSLNNGEVPPLRVSRSFRDTINAFSKNRGKLSRAQKETYTYTRQKVESAKVFIDAVNRRRNNMLATMEAIVEFQKPFFLEGDENLLRPMILKDIAVRTGLDKSTISRVSNSKYVETDFGVFPLKYFFNEKYVTADGSVHSTTAIRNALAQIIESENKKEPYSDETLAEMLRQKGFPVARRTVAKYRQQLGLPVARLRK